MSIFKKNNGTKHDVQQPCKRNHSEKKSQPAKVGLKWSCAMKKPDIKQSAGTASFVTIVAALPVKLTTISLRIGHQVIKLSIVHSRHF